MKRIDEAITNLQGYADTLTRLGKVVPEHINTALAALRTMEWIKDNGLPMQHTNELIAKFNEFLGGGK